MFWAGLSLKDSTEKIGIRFFLSLMNCLGVSVMYCTGMYNICSVLCVIYGRDILEVNINNTRHMLFQAIIKLKTLNSAQGLQQMIIS